VRARNWKSALCSDMFTNIFDVLIGYTNRPHPSAKAFVMSQWTVPHGTQVGACLFAGKRS
jgi:hypothetical protein